MSRLVTRALLALLALTLSPFVAAQTITPPQLPGPATYGEFDLSTCGIIMGQGRSSADRQGNVAVINVCNVLARDAGLIPTAPAGDIEVEGGATITVNGTPVKAGILVPSGSKGFKGATPFGTVITQWSADYPVIEFGGDPRTEVGIHDAYIADLKVGMGVTGTSGSRCFLFGRLYYSRIERLDCNRYASLGGTNGIKHPSIGWDFIIDSGNLEFSNSFDTTKGGAGQINLFRKHVNSTGSHWSNGYWGDGSPNDHTTLTGSVISIANDFQGVFNQWNAEWQITGANLPIVNINNSVQLTLNSWHFEGNIGAGFSPAGINVITSSVNLNGLEFFDWQNTSASGVTGIPKLFGSFGQSQIIANGVEARFNTGGAGAYGVMDIPWVLYEAEPFGSLPASQPNVRVFNFHTQGASGAFSLDSTLPVATFGNVTDFGSYVYNRGRSTTEGAKINVTNAAFSLWGVHQNAFINYTGAVSANRLVTVQENMATSGSGANVPRPVNDTPVIYRDSTATGAFNVQFARGRDATAIGTALSAASTGYALDPQLIQRNIATPDVVTLTDADQTVYFQGAGTAIITPTILRAITLSGNYSASIATSAPRGSCKTFFVTVGAAFGITVNGTAVLVGTSRTFCTSNGTGTVVQVSSNDNMPAIMGEARALAA